MTIAATTRLLGVIGHPTHLYKSPSPLQTSSRGPQNINIGAQSIKRAPFCSKAEALNINGDTFCCVVDTFYLSRGLQRCKRGSQSISIEGFCSERETICSDDWIMWYPFLPPSSDRIVLNSKEWVFHSYEGSQRGW